MRLPLLLALRLSRGGARGLGVALLCLLLGVAAIAAVGSLRAGVSRGLAEDGRALLGGDLEVQTGPETPPAELMSWLKVRGARTSVVTRMRSLLVGPSGERALIDLQAVDEAWPLVGAPVLDPTAPPQRALGRQPDGRFGILVDPVALARLRARPGDVLRVGTQAFTATASLVSSPDRVAGPALFGAPAVISAAALPGTGLEVPGAMISHAVRAVLPASSDTAGIAAALRDHFRDRGWQVRLPKDAAPGIRRFVDQTALFMNLAGLTALLVGGVGVASGVRAWLDDRAQSLAVLRCLGASSRTVLAVAALEVSMLASLGIIVGILIGALAPILAGAWLAQLLPVPPQAGLYPGPLLLAAGYGALTTACFALPPLSRAMRLPGAALFRDALTPEAETSTPPAAIGLAAFFAAALAGLAILAATDRSFALGFCGAALGGLFLFRLGGSALVRILRRLPDLPWITVKLGLGNLARPGAATGLLLTSVGLGLATLAGIVLIDGNIRHAILEEMPEGAPSLYFVDLQPGQIEAFRALVRTAPGVQSVETVPSLRARIVAVNGIPVDQVQATPETRWALRGDRGLTYAATPPPETRLVAGRWWPADYAGPPLVSLDAALARGWGIGVGATIRVNVLGRDLDLKVASLRDVAWRRLGLNFVLVASPGLLSAAPHTAIATVRLPPSEEAGLLRRVSDALPNVTAISVSEILHEVARLLSQIAVALAATSAVTLASGLLVLIGAVAAGRRRRIQEAVILRALGATRRQLRLAWLTEFGVLGVVAGALAAAAGTGGSWLVMHAVLDEPWTLFPERLAATIAGGLALMLAAGYAGIAAAASAKPASRLRNE